ncbi:MAG TPA: CPBP family intramembrane glutamic endopeptidase [Rhodanobacteraceae bacterium]
MDLPTDAAPLVTDAVMPAEPTPPRRPGIWSGLGTVALYFLLQIVLGFLVGAACGVALALAAGFRAGLHHQHVDINGLKQSISANPDLRVTVAVVTISLAAAVMAWFVHRIWRAQWSVADVPGLGVTKPTSAIWYLVAIGMGVLLLVVGNVLTVLLAHGHAIHQDVGVMFGNATPMLRVLMVVMVVCAAPFVEELVFRGVLLSGLAHKLSISWAMLVSAIIFGCAHLPDFNVWYPVPALILLGLGMAWVRVRSRSLWPSVTLHATNNLLAVGAWFLTAHH